MPTSRANRKSSSTKSTKKSHVNVAPLAASRPRRLRLPPYRPFRLRGRVKHPVRLPSVWQLSKKTAQLLWRHRWLFLGIAIIYGLLNIILVRGFSSGTDVNSLKQQFDKGFNGNLGQLALGFSVFTALLASSGNSSSTTAGAYQLFLGLIVSLATIWTLRQVVAGERVRLREAFYRGMYPLIPFILVLLVVLLQTVPFLIGGSLYSIVISNGIAVQAIEKLLWGLLFLVLAVISIYMLCSSLFALYIVTLPDMTPMRALKSARELVRYRRSSVFRKLLFLPFGLLAVAIAIMIPVILIAAPAAPWIFFILTVAALIVVHAYMYTLYRELLK